MLGDVLKIIRPMQLAQPSRPSFLNGSAQTDMANETAKASSTVGDKFDKSVNWWPAHAAGSSGRPLRSPAWQRAPQCNKCHGAYSSFEKKEGAEERRFGLLAQVSCRLDASLMLSASSRSTSADDVVAICLLYLSCPKKNLASLLLLWLWELTPGPQTLTWRS